MKKVKTRRKGVVIWSRMGLHAAASHFGGEEVSKVSAEIKNVTDLDVILTAAFYPILIQMAREGQGGPATQMNYDLLRQFAKEESPSLADQIDACANQKVGRHLEFIRLFTEEKGYPDVTALIVNKETDEVGSGFVGDPLEARKRIAAFDWNKVEPEFELYIADLRKLVKRKRVMKPAEAKAQVIAYAKARGIKTADPTVRPRLADLVMEGTPIDEAFKLVVGDPAPA